jgi:hypothetical protein
MSDFFDRLVEEIVSSPHAPDSHGAARAVAATQRARFKRSALARTRSGRRLLVAIALLCVSGTVGGLALAGTFGGQRISPQQWVNGQRVRPAVAITPAQSAKLGILRRPRVASDALLPWDAFSATHTPMAANGVNPSLSRRAEGFASGAAWVIPGNGTICLIAVNVQGLAMASEQLAPGSTTPSPVARIHGADGATGCTTDSNAAKGWSAGTGGTHESPGMTFTAGIVPDDVTAVTVSLAGGGPLSLPVHENVYMAEVHGWPSSVSFTGPAGPVTIGNGLEPAPLARTAEGRRAAEADRNGQACRRAEQQGPYAHGTCRPTAEQPPKQPAFTAASVAAPVSLTPHTERVRLGGHGTALERILIVSFRARAPVIKGTSDYRILMSCGVDEIEGAVTHGVRRGQLVHNATGIGLCHGALHVTVLYTFDAHPNGVPDNLRGPTLTVGTQTYTVR